MKNEEGLGVADEQLSPLSAARSARPGVMMKS